MPQDVVELIGEDRGWVRCSTIPCTVLTVMSRRYSTSGIQDTRETVLVTGRSAVSATGGIVDERVSGNPQEWRLRRDEKASPLDRGHL